MSASANAAAAGPTKKGKLPLIIGLVVLLAGGGGGYFWWSKQQAVKAAEAAKSGDAAKAGHGDGNGHDGAESHGEGDEASGEETAGALVALDTFTVNLADPDAPRFLRTNVQLVIDATEEDAKHLEEEKLPVVRARAAVLELLTQQTSQVINTPEGKAELKKQIKKSTAKLLHHTVTDVLFSDFVIQF
jgi:flagellar protein FliL